MTDWELEIEREYHEASYIFPMMQDAEYSDLKSDIAQNGLLEPIWLHPSGSIIDGRNRHRACIDTGTAPQFRTWHGKGSLVSFVVSLNLHRRHLTSSQRAACSLDALEMLEKEAQERMSRGGAKSKPSQQGTEIFPYLSKDVDAGSGEAREKAAQIFQTNPRYVSDAKKLQTEAPDLLDEVRSGEKTIPKAKEELARRNQHVMGVMGSSESPEWYTPPHIIKLTLELFGGEIDTDPCSNSKDAPNVPARILYTKDDDGLSLPWSGKIYMNPPYGKKIPDWTNAIVSKFKSGEIDEGVALLPGRIDTQWFQPLYAFLICNIRGRLNYPQSRSATPFPSVIVYLGYNDSRFIDVFGRLGPILQRVG